jgi:hypothetical protein
MRVRQKKQSSRHIEVVPYSDGDEATWLRKSLSKDAKRFIHELLDSRKQGRKKGGATTGDKKRAAGLTKAHVAAAERKILARGERATNKRLAKELGGKHPDYIRRLRKEDLS